VLRTGLGSWSFSQIIALPLHIVLEVLTKSRFKAPFSSCQLAHCTRGVNKVEVYCIHTHNTDSLRIASRWSRVLRTGLGSWSFSQIIALPLHIVREVLTKSRFKAPFSSCHLAHSTRGVSSVLHALTRHQGTMIDAEGCNRFNACIVFYMH
jgi:hypothetical protein